MKRVRKRREDTGGQVTMADLARAAGVSVMTVSRCLRDDPRQSAETRERISALAARMGYRPNPLVATLMAQVREKRVLRGTATVALLGYYPEYILPRSPTWRRLAAGAVARAESLGFRAEWIGLEGFEGQSGYRRLHRMLLARGIRGAVLFPVDERHGELPFACEGLAVSAIGYSLHRPAVHRATHHHYVSVREARALLEGRGARRFAVAARRQFMARTDWQWLAGLAVRDSGKCHVERVGCFAPWPEPKDLKAAFAKWLEKTAPDVLFALEPMVEWWAELRAKGRTRCAVANLDWSLEWGRFPGVDQQSERVGAAAVDLVVAGLNRNETGLPEYQKIVTTAGRWVEGDAAG